MSRITDKAARLLTERRVVVLADRIDAHVTGDSGDHLTSIWQDDSGRLVWDCDCEYGNHHAKACSHVEALRLIWRPTLKRIE